MSEWGQRLIATNEYFALIRLENWLPIGASINRSLQDWRDDGKAVKVKDKKGILQRFDQKSGRKWSCTGRKGQRERERERERERK